MIIKKFNGRNKDVFVPLCFKSELLFIKLPVTGFKSSVDSRKLCNLDCQNFFKIHI